MHSLTAVLLMSAIFTLSGCADLHLYSPARDQLGKTALKAWADADALSSIRVQRENSAALLANELAYVETASLIKRDRLFEAIVVGPSIQADLVSKVDAALLTLAGDEAFQRGLTEAKKRQTSFASQYEQAMVEVQRHGFESFSCADLTSGKAEQSVADWLATYKAKQAFPAQVFEGALASAKQLCSTKLADSTAVRDQIAAEATAAQVNKTQLPTVIRETAELYAAEQALKTRETDKASDRNAYRAALKNYREVLKGAPPPATVAAESAPANGDSAPQAANKQGQIAQALGKLKTAIDKVKGWSDKYSLKFISEERITAIDEFLGTMLDPKPAGDPIETDKDRVARVLRLLDETADNWKAAQANAKEVLTRPLLLQQAMDALQVETLARSIAADEADVELRRQRVQLLEQQAHNYRQAQGFLKGTQAHHGGSLQTVIFKDKDPSQNLRSARARIMQASAHYGYAAGYLAGQLDGTALKKQALLNARNLDAAEINVRQWTTLIGSNVEMLTAWSATGVKEETITRGINAVLLLWIGMGVN